MGVFYKKLIILLIILPVLIIQCSNESSGESEKSQIETEIIKYGSDTFVYEESETNIIKTNKTKTAFKENKNKGN